MLLRRVELGEKACTDFVTFRTSWEWHRPVHLPNGMVAAMVGMPRL